jgi:transposase
MKEGLLGGTLGVSSRSVLEEARLHVARWTGSESPEDRRVPAVAAGEIVEEWASPPDADGVSGLARRAGAHGLPVHGVVESMTGARFVHDTLEEIGWEVLIADAAKVKGLAPLACKIDARVLAVLSRRDLVPEIWLPDPSIRRERELARFRLQLVSTASAPR